MALKVCGGDRGLSNGGHNHSNEQGHDEREGVAHAVSSGVMCHFTKSVYDFDISCKRPESIVNATD